MNRSPWLEELENNRQVKVLDKNLETEVVIVGAGIAGVSTAYFILKNTNKKVTVLEKGLFAHGASGYNAGLLVAEFERSLFDIAKEFDPKMVVEAQREIENAWNLLNQIITESQISIPLDKFIGYGGLRKKQDILEEIGNIYFKKENGLSAFNLLISDELDISFLDDKYKKYIELIPHKKLLELLETENTEYTASTRSDWGVSNSALLCEKILCYLEGAYSDRFDLFENSNVTKITLGQNIIKMVVGQNEVTAEKTVLCTNGFEYFEIQNEDKNKNVDFHFHTRITGEVGYMMGFVDKKSNPSGFFYNIDNKLIDMSVLPKKKEAVEPYLYISNRPRGDSNFVCIGGAESTISEQVKYNPNLEYPEEKQEVVKRMLKNIKNIDLDSKSNYYRWHGLMGYTPNGVRIVGSDIDNCNLLYNLGCNGTGLLPSISGGERISKILNNEKLQPSIFDPN